MPVYATNTVTIKGERHILDLFEEKRLEFAYFVPIPPEIENADHDIYRRWCMRNWGTKWSNLPRDTKIDNRSENELTLIFQTAFGMPEEFFMKLLEIYPDISIFCNWEDECGSSGWWEGSVKDGIPVINSKTWNDEDN